MLAAKAGKTDKSRTDSVQSDRVPETTGISRYIPSLYTVAAIAVLGAIFVIALLPRVETDFWWHIKVGQFISQHHTVPSRDYMSFTFAGHAWTDHEWLAELGLYGLYRLVGLWGPIIFFAAAITVSFIFVYLTMLQRGINRVLGLFILSAAFTASRGSWGPRIQMLSMLFLSIYMFVLYRYIVTRDRRLLLIFPVIMLVWCNVHAGFAVGLVVMGATLVGETLNYLTKNEDALSLAEIRALGYALIGTFAVTIINPNGIRQLLYPLAFVLPNAYTNQIEESASPNFHMLVMTIFEGLLLLLIVSGFLTRSRVNWTNLLLILGFTHLALSQVRNVALWVIVVTPMLAMYVSNLGPVVHDLFPGWTYRRRPVRGRIVPILNGVLLAMVVLVYVAEAHIYITPKALAQATRDTFPIGGVKYLKTHKLPPRVYTSYSWGGYVLWNLFPKYRDFMDSRADTLFNTQILNSYLDAYTGTPRWKSVLKQYGVQDVFIEQEAPLAQLLAMDKSWRLVYHDYMSVIYVKRQ